MYIVYIAILNLYDVEEAEVTIDTNIIEHQQTYGKSINNWNAQNVYALFDLLLFHPVTIFSKPLYDVTVSLLLSWQLLLW